MDRDRFLSFARRLALVGSVSPMACAGSNATTTTTTTAPTTTASSTTSSNDSPPSDATAGSGSCRCSWDTDATSAPRVCKKGEVNYAGYACIPGGGNSYSEGGGMPVPGTVPPPELV